MKKLMKSLMLFAAAAMAFTSCQNEEFNEGIEANETFTVNFVTDAPESRTSVSIEGGAANFAWGENEKFQFIQNTPGQTALTLGTGVTFTNNAGKGEISATFTGDAATSYNFTAIYPAAAWVDGTDVSKSLFNSAKLYFKDAQNLVAGSFDPNADLMVSKMITGTPAEVSAEAQSLQFTRLVAIAEVNLKLLQVAEDEKITGFTFAAGATDEIAGRAYVDLETAEVVDYTYYGATNTIKLTNADGIEANDESVKVYFTCIPTTIAAGTTVTFTVTTNKATYTKEVALPKDLTFEAGKVKAVGIDMKDAGVEYLDDMSGDYIIVAKRSSGNFFYLSPSNSINATRIDAIDTNATTTDAVEMNEAYKWTIAKSGNAYTIGAGSKYIAWTSGNTATLAATGDTMNITKLDGGYYNISLTKDGTRIFQLNNSTYNYFAFYTSTQVKNLYLIPFVVDEREALATPVVTAEVEDMTAIVANWNAVEGADHYLVTINPDEEEEGEIVTKDTTWTFNDRNYSTTYTISVVAVPADTENRRNSAAGSVTATTDADPEATGPATVTIAEFLAAANPNIVYQLTGEITGTYNTTYGNFYLKDATGTLQIYGTQENGQNCWTSKGLKDGDIITLQGAYGTYNSTPQIKNAKYISHYTLTVTPASSSIGAEGGDITIAVSTTSGEAITASIATNDFATLSYNGGASATVSFSENKDAARSVNVTFTSGLATKTITLSQMSGNVSSDTKYYVKVTSAPSDWSGTYIIVHENTASVGYVFKSNDVSSQKNYTTNTVIDSGKIEAVDDLNKFAVVVDKYSTGYSIKSVGSSKYLEGKGSSSNGTNANASASKPTTFALKSDGTVTITNNTNIFAFNTQGYMRYYKSGTVTGNPNGYKTMCLYKLED